MTNYLIPLRVALQKALTDVERTRALAKSPTGGPKEHAAFLEARGFARGLKRAVEIAEKHTK